MEISEGQPQQCKIGQSKICFPVRGATKLDIIRIINDIEVDDESAKPFKQMRYPIEDGQKHQNLIATRTAWFQKTLDFDAEKAAKWTEEEFTALFGTEQQLMDPSDPGDTIAKLSDLNLPNDLLAKAKQETRKFFAAAEKGLILLTPMKTYPKQRYHPGVNTDLLYGKEWPDPMSYWTANTENMSNILTQVNLTGYYSPKEEAREVLVEKSQLRVATEFGQEANVVRNEHNQGYLDFLQQRLGRLGGDKPPTKQSTMRPVRVFAHRGYNNSESGASSSSASTTAISESPPKHKLEEVTKTPKTAAISTTVSILVSF